MTNQKQFVASSEAKGISTLCKTCESKARKKRDQSIDLQEEITEKEEIID